MKSKVYFVLILGIITFISIGWGLNSTFNSYQAQIDRRDSLIKQYALKEDSLRNSNTELIKSLNKLFSNADVENDGEFDVAKFIDKHNSLKDTIDRLKRSLELIKKNYGISATVRRRSTKDNKIITTTSIQGSDKIDSALILLPYFRDRLVNNENNTWTINLTGEEYEAIKKNYEDNIGRYNSLVGNYNTLLKDYNGLVNKYNEKINFYRNMLEEMSKKGVVEIDSVGSDLIYRY